MEGFQPAHYFIGSNTFQIVDQAIISLFNALGTQAKFNFRSALADVIREYGPATIDEAKDVLPSIFFIATQIKAPEVIAAIESKILTSGPLSRDKELVSGAINVLTVHSSYPEIIYPLYKAIDNPSFEPKKSAIVLRALVRADPNRTFEFIKKLGHLIIRLDEERLEIIWDDVKMVVGERWDPIMDRLKNDDNEISHKLYVSMANNTASLSVFSNPAPAEFGEQMTAFRGVRV